MKNFKKALGIILAVVMIMQLGAIGFAADGNADYTIVSPYEKVIWEGDGAWGAYKGTLHTHTTYSDGNDTLPVMIKEYYNQDYDFVANADHGITGVEWDKTPDLQPLYLYQPIIDNPYAHLTTEEFRAITGGTYPLYDGTVRNKPMVCVTGANEFNNLSLTKNHVNGYFLPTDVGNGFPGAENELGYEQAIAFIDEHGGLSHINHPGDWLASNSNPDIVNDEYSVKFFGDLILKYDSCLGTEVFNERNGTTGYDRNLWDNLLLHCLPYGKNVIGFSNTDAHYTDDIDTSFMVFMMPVNNVYNIRQTMQSGSLFMITRKIRPNDILGPTEELDVRNQGLPYPMFTSLTVDGHTVNVSAVDCDTIKWVADGKVIAEESIAGGTASLNLDTIEGAENFTYVRAELVGEGGLCLSQALVIDDGSEPETFVAEELSFLDKLTIFFKGTKIYAIIMEIVNAI